MLLLFATHVATAVLAAVLTLSLCRLTCVIRHPLSPAHFVALSKEIASAAWTRRVRAAAKRNGKCRGRPRVPDALERHILQIKRENPSYGQQRIAAILSHAVGAPVCANTVAAVCDDTGGDSGAMEQRQAPSRRQVWRRRSWVCVAHVSQAARRYS